MERQEITQEDMGMKQYCGYTATPIWNQGEGSTHYDYKLDTQCSIPAASPREILEGLGLEP